MLHEARLRSTEARQIDSDVNRQFRDHFIYRERYGIKQKSLFNVLTAYSMYNMEVEHGHMAAHIIINFQIKLDILCDFFFSLGGLLPGNVWGGWRFTHVHE